MNVDIDEMIHWNWWLLPLVITEKKCVHCMYDTDTLDIYRLKTKKEKAMLGKIRQMKEDEKNLYSYIYLVAAVDIYIME